MCKKIDRSAGHSRPSRRIGLIRRRRCGFFSTLALVWVFWPPAGAQIFSSHFRAGDYASGIMAADLKRDGKIYPAVAIPYNESAATTSTSSAGGSWPGVVQVQNNLDTSTTLYKSFSVPITTSAGNLLVAFVRESSNGTDNFKVTDSAGQAWELTASGYENESSTGPRIGMFYAANSQAVTSVTARFKTPGGVVKPGIMVMELSGMALSGVADGSVNGLSGAATATSMSGFLTTTQANDILIFATDTAGNQNPPGWAAGTHYAIPNNRLATGASASNARMAIEDALATFPGNFSATMSYSAMAWNGNIFAAFKVASSTLTPTAALTPSSLNFGSQAVGTTSSPQAATLTNTGNTYFNITLIDFNSDTGSNDFAQTNNCPSSLPPKSACQINITFIPQTSGALSSSLAVWADFSQAISVNAGVSGTGTTSSAGGPAISSFSPASGPVGSSVTISGSGFTGTTKVSFNGTAAAFTVNSDSQITATVPSGATTGPIAVSTSGGSATSSTNFTVTAGTTPPTITSFSPTSGPPGTVVTIIGSGFTGATSVIFDAPGGPDKAQFTVNSDTQITATVPGGATDGFTVTTPAGTANSPTLFTVTQGLAVVQVQNNLDLSGTLFTTFSVNIQNSPGDLLVAFVRESSNGTDNFTVTDSAGDAWTLAAAGYKNESSTGPRIGVFYFSNSFAISSVTVHFTTPGGVAKPGIMVMEIAGEASVASTVADGSVANASGASVATSTSGALTTTNANDILIFATDTAANETGWTAGTGYSILNNKVATGASSSNARMAMQYKIVSATQSNATTSMGFTNSAWNGNIFVAFK